MERQYLGELEELVLMCAAALKEDAYGVAIVAEIADTTGRSVNIGAIHTVLRRLENKGFLESKLGGATKQRGGRRKRIYRITYAGEVVLREMYEVRIGLFKRISFSL